MEFPMESYKYESGFCLILISSSKQRKNIQKGYVDKVPVFLASSHLPPLSCAAGVIPKLQLEVPTSKNSYESLSIK